MESQVAPSILSADFARLGEQIKAVEPFAGRIHVDVMDGHFVPNLTMGPMVVRSIRPVTELPVEVHLMVEEPEKFASAFAEAGADRLIFHIEVTDDPQKVAGLVRAAGCSAGLAVNPDTPWGKVEAFIEQVDLVTLMTVFPGFGGQDFIAEVLPKIEQARGRISEMGLNVDIEVDGGIDPDTAALAKKAGANVFVAGHSIFRSKDPASAAEALHRVVSGSRR